MSKNFENNFTFNEEKETVNWKEVKIIKVQKDLSFTILYKYSYKPKEFSKIINKKTTHARNSNPTNEIILPHAYRKPPRITTKKKHLLEVCKGNNKKSLLAFLRKSGSSR